MIYISIDVETTGLDPENNQILSIGAIIEDTQKKLPFEEVPKFNVAVLHHQIMGHPRAITMNKDLIRLINIILENDDIEFMKNEKELSQYLYLKPDEVSQEFFDFLWKNGLGYTITDSGKTVRIIDHLPYPVFSSNTKPILINVAGKNFGTFDKLFLEKLPWWKKLITVKQRIIDPSILCCDWNNDDALPSLKQCKERLDVKGLVTHNALEDAWDVIQILRKFY